MTCLAQFGQGFPKICDLTLGVFPPKFSMLLAAKYILRKFHRCNTQYEPGPSLSPYRVWNLDFANVNFCFLFFFFFLSPPIPFTSLQLPFLTAPLPISSSFPSLPPLSFPPLPSSPIPSTFLPSPVLASPSTGALSLPYHPLSLPSVNEANGSRAQFCDPGKMKFGMCTKFFVERGGSMATLQSAVAAGNGNHCLQILA